MTRFKTFIRAGTALAALAAAASPASAQRVSRIVAFGDSYADTGNFFALTGIPRPSVYPNGRFSNGTNFVDTMAQILGVPQDNFAIGGAFTNNGNINGPGIPGFVTEYQSFLAGGGPAAFPRVSGKFGPNDLAVVSIGGNDARAYEKSLGNNPSAAQIQGLLAGIPAQATQKVAEATAGFNALVGAGARNFTVIAGDVGRMPEVQGLAISQVGSAYATAFNTGLQAQLSQIASTGVIVNYLDLNKVGDQVAANLSAFGLISAGACPVACVSSDASLAEKYLFYVDQVHLTSRGFAIVGQYAVRQLEAPLQLQAQTDTGLFAAQAFGASLQGRLDLSGARGGSGVDGIAFYVTGNAASQDVGASNQSLGYEMNSGGASAGVEFGAGPALIGAAVSYSQPKADFATDTGRVKAKAWHVGAYGAVAVGGAFGQAYAGYGWLDYDIRRTAVIDEIHAAPSGRSALAGAKVGYLAGLGGLSVGPVLALDYARTRIGAYTETGDPVLTNNVSRQEVHALVGSAGLELRGHVESGGLGIRPYASLVAEKDLDGDGRTIRYAGTAAPTIVNTWNLPGRSKDTHARLTAGASFELIGSLSLQVQGSKSFGRDGGNDMNGFAGLKIGF